MEMLLLEITLSQIISFLSHIAYFQEQKLSSNTSPFLEESPPKEANIILLQLSPLYKWHLNHGSVSMQLTIIVKELSLPSMAEALIFSDAQLTNTLL